MDLHDEGRSRKSRSPDLPSKAGRGAARDDTKGAVIAHGTEALVAGTLMPVLALVLAEIEYLRRRLRLLEELLLGV